MYSISFNNNNNKIEARNTDSHDSNKIIKAKLILFVINKK